MNNAQIAMIGLSVMGSNLARNIEGKGFRIAVFNRTEEVTRKFMDEFGTDEFVPVYSYEELMESLERPRKIMVMVKAGGPTDAVIDSLLPLLESGDMILDCGNAHYQDTRRRVERCQEAGIDFLGVGVSGGEEGALNGPSIMPGGKFESWKEVAPIFEKIAAQVGEPCTAYMGPDGAGHFVKTVHNGIEYGDMQLIAEAYDLLSGVRGLSPGELADVFKEWNQGVLSSYLIEITGEIFAKEDELGDGFLIDKILDKAGQKGTGKWTVQEACELGVAIPTIGAAVTARILSSMKAERLDAEHQLAGASPEAVMELPAGFVQTVHDALYCAKIIAYAQGMALLSTASKEYDWSLNLGEIASIWRGGCIIRAQFLDKIRHAYDSNTDLPNLLLDDFLKAEVIRCLPSLRLANHIAVEMGVPVPAFNASLSYLDSYRRADLPQNLTQAQRDYFGAHTYERKDREGTFHTEW